jgi:hypothetical protein
MQGGHAVNSLFILLCVPLRLSIFPSLCCCAVCWAFSASSLPTLFSGPPGKKYLDRNATIATELASFRKLNTSLASTPPPASLVSAMGKETVFLGGLGLGTQSQELMAGSLKAAIGATGR